MFVRVYRGGRVGTALSHTRTHGARNVRGVLGTRERWGPPAKPDALKSFLLVVRILLKSRMPRRAAGTGSRAAAALKGRSNNQPSCYIGGTASTGVGMMSAATTPSLNTCAPSSLARPWKKWPRLVTTLRTSLSPAEVMMGPARKGRLLQIPPTCWPASCRIAVLVWSGARASEWCGVGFRRLPASSHRK